MFYASSKSHCMKKWASIYFKIMYMVCNLEKISLFDTKSLYYYQGIPSLMTYFEYMICTNVKVIDIEFTNMLLYMNII